MKDNNIKEMMDIATSENKESVAIEQHKKTSPTKLIAGFLLLFLLIGALVIIFIPKGNAPVGPNIGEGDADLAERWQTANYPVELPRWTRSLPYGVDEFYSNDNLATIKEMEAWSEGTTFGFFIQSFISKSDSDENGNYFTNDISKVTIDGEPNLMYSYTLREDYLRTFAIASQRFLNPTFGGWNRLQDNQFNLEEEYAYVEKSFENIFVPGTQPEMKDMPLFADWDGSGYDGAKLSPTVEDNLAFWYGVIDEDFDSGRVGEYELTGKDLDLTVKVTLPVKYYAFGEGGTTLTRTGVLTFEMTPNPNDNDENHRVLVKSASLSMD